MHVRVGMLCLMMAAAVAAQPAKDRSENPVRDQPRTVASAAPAMENGSPLHPDPSTTNTVVARTPDGGRVELESAAVTFGSAIAEEQKELPSAVTIRVFSSRRWSLRLTPSSPLANSDRGEAVDWSRIQWRGRGGRYESLSSNGVVVARGLSTGPGGQLVTIDLRLAFEASDPLGRYASTLHVGLESF